MLIALILTTYVRIPHILTKYVSIFFYFNIVTIYKQIPFYNTLCTVTNLIYMIIILYKLARMCNMNQGESLKKISKAADCYDKTSEGCCKTYQPVTSHGIVNIVKNYYPHKILQYSDWIDCSALNKYYYFVQNLGYGDVEAYIEISPDKKLVYKDSDKIIIKSCEVSYLQPLRDSRYIRFSYKSLNSAGISLITTWFQAK